MHGFQPKHARGKPAQALADGGLVHSITGMLGMRKKTPEEMLAADAKVQERNREAAARVAARAKPAQQAAPAEEKAVSSYAGMSAMQRREQAAGLKDGGTVGGFKPGGLIRGPGTGTSDSIETEKRPGTFIMPADSTQAIGPEALQSLGAPKGMPEAEGMEEPGDMDDRDEPEGEKVPVRLSNGEFELPPEQVQALGEAVLTVLRDATHTPVEGGKPTAKGFAPNQFFANGGTVFGSRGLAGLREVIPKVQAMGYPQAQQPAQAPAGSRDLAALKAMIPKMEAMGYTQALADGGMVENEVTRVGNSYSGGNVGGSVSINGQAGAGTMSTVPAPVAAAPVPAASATPGATPGATPAAAPAAPMGWAERNAQRSNEVTASSIMDSPERRAAQAKLTPTPAPVATVAPTTPAVGGIPSAATAMDATNPKPFGAQPTSPFGFKPRGYADGGTVRDEEKQRLANQSAMYVLGAQTAAANRQPAPPEAAASQVQNKAPTRTAAPFATTTPTSAGFMPGTRAVFNESGKAIGDLANQGRYAAAAGETAHAALAYVPAVVDDVVGGAVRAVGPALADAGKQFLGMNEAAAPAPAPVPAAAAKTPGPAAPTGTTQANAAPTGQVAIQPMNDGAQPVAPPPSTAAAPQPQAEQVAPGAYRYGRGQYGDSPTGQQGMVSGPAGQPSAQNMAAADALVARQTPAGFQPAGSQPAGVQAPVVRNSTNDWAARKALANAETAASSITNTRRWGGKGAENSPDVQAYQAMLRNDLALQQAQPGLDQTAMRENAGITREGMQQAGATTRTGMQEQGSNTRDARRNALTAEELGLRREAQGFQTRAAAQQEQLRNTLIDPKATPEQRKQAQEYLQALAVSDKEPSPQYKSYVMPAIRNADGSTTEGSVYQENTRTGEGRWVKPQGDGQAQQAMPKPASKAEFDALPKGTRFTDPNGQVRIK